MKKNILYGLTLLLLISCNAKRSDLESKENSGERVDYQIDCNGSLLNATKYNDTLSLIKIVKNDSVIIKSIYPKEEGEFIESYKFFKYKGDTYFRALIVAQGTGNFNYDYLCFIDTSTCNVEEVEIKYASDYYRKFLKENEGIWKGEYRDYTDSLITSFFHIYDDNDANCCPSVGEVKAICSIKVINNKYSLEQDTCIFKKY